MKTLLFLLLSTWATSPYDLYVDEKLLGDLQEVKEITYPSTIEITSDKTLPLNILLSLGGRKLYSIEEKTNKKVIIPQFEKIDQIVIKVNDDKGKSIYRLKVKPKEDN